jgi:hypothetical protein
MPIIGREQLARTRLSQVNGTAFSLFQRRSFNDCARPSSQNYSDTRDADCTRWRGRLVYPLE